MLKYPCLVLDHDDTVVQSELTVNFPYLLMTLKTIRPGMTITPEKYADGCFRLGFADMCRQNFGFTEQELLDEYLGWKEYIKTHIPAPFPGIGNIIRRQKALGGKLFVVSHSCNENITRDYEKNFGILPDGIFGWDLPEALRKPSDYALKTIMEQYGFAPREMLVVDDMLLGCTMAKKQHVPVAFAAWGRQGCPGILQEMRQACDFSFDTTRQLENFLFDENERFTPLDRAGII